MNPIFNVRLDQSAIEFCGLFPGHHFSSYTALTLAPEQKAIFCRDGRVFDVIGTSLNSLSPLDIPLLAGYLGLNPDSNCEFDADILIVNQSVKSELPWGTKSPLSLMDPVAGVCVPVRSFGKYSVRVSSPETFVSSMSTLGLLDVAPFETIGFIRDKIFEILPGAISRKLGGDAISVAQLSQHLPEYSSFCIKELSQAFSSFGLQLENFYFLSINLPEDDPAVRSLRYAQQNAQFQQPAEPNEPAEPIEPAEPVVPYADTLSTDPVYQIYANNRRYDAKSEKDIYEMLCDGTLTAYNFVLREGLPNWTRINKLAELEEIVSNSYESDR